MNVAIIDYEAGNLGSVKRVLLNLGVEAKIVHSPQDLAYADKIILPGVGSLYAGMYRLNQSGLANAIKEAVLLKNKPILGICLGMQMLATSGNEGGQTTGLNLVPGIIKHLTELGCNERIPHVGWNSIQKKTTYNPLLTGIPDETDVYFVHGYAYSNIDPEYIITTTDYGIPIVSSINKGLAWGVQFHPEKSSKAGIRLIKNFLAV